MQKPRKALAYYVLKMPEAEVKQFAVDMYDARRKVKYCKNMRQLVRKRYLRTCARIPRDRSVICVVKDARDVFAIEKTHEYRGLYHVLEERFPARGRRAG